MLQRRICWAISCVLFTAMFVGCGGESNDSVDDMERKRPKGPYAETLLRVCAAPDDVLSQGKEQPFDAEQFDLYRQTQLALIKSRLVLDAALGKPGILDLECIVAADDPLAWLRERLNVAFLGDSEILSLRVYHNEADEAKQLAKAIQEAYMDEIVFSERKEALVRADILKRTYRMQVTSLKEMQNSLWQLEEQIGTDASVQAQISRELATEKLRSILRRKARAAERLDEIESEIGLLTPDTDTDEAEPDESVDSADASPDAAALKMLAKEQKLIKAKMVELKKLREDAEQELRSLGGRSADLETRRLEIQALVESTTMLRREIDRIELNLQREPRVRVIQPPFAVP